MRDFLYLCDETGAWKDVFAELRPVVKIEASLWALQSGSVYVAPFEFIFDSMRRDVVAVKSLVDAEMTRVQSIAECEALPGSFFYDPDEEFGQEITKWDQLGATWDMVGELLDQFPNLYVHLSDGSDPGETVTAAVLGFYFSNAGQTTLGDPQVHPALSDDLLLAGGFEDWTESAPDNWASTGSGIQFWDDGDTNWDDAGVIWDPLTATIVQNTTDIREGSSSLELDVTGSISRTLSIDVTELIVGKQYRFSGWYQTQAACDAQVRIGNSAQTDTIEPVGGRALLASRTFTSLTRSGPEWRRFVFDFRATATTEQIELRALGDGGVRGTVLFDGLELRRVWRWNWYEPRIATGSVPAIQTGSNDIFFGGKSIGSGSIKLMNHDGWLEELAAEVEWMNQTVKVMIGGQFPDSQELLIDDWFAGFSGLVQDIRFTDSDAEFSLQDQRVFFHLKLPTRVYDDQEFPDMDTQRQGAVRPLFFGVKEHIDPVRIDQDGTTSFGTYELADCTDAPNGITSIDTIYAFPTDGDATNNRTDLAATLDAADYSQDLANGQFEILRDIGPYTVTEINRRLDFNIGGGSLVATLDVGVYTGTQFADLVANAMTAAAAATITCTLSASTHLFTIAKSSGTLQLLIKTGTNAAIGAYHLMGYNLSADKTGSLTYAADNATFTDVDKNHILRVSAQGYKDDSDGTFTGVASSLMEIGSDICRCLLMQWMGKPASIIDETSFEFARERAPESLAIYLNESLSTKDLFDRFEYSNIANIVVDGEGKVFYHVYVGDVPDDITDLRDSDIAKFESGASNSEVFTTIRVHHDKDPETGVFEARDAAETSVSLISGRPDIREFETFIKQADNAILAASRLLELAKTPARKIKFTSLGSKMMNLEVGDKFRLSRTRAYAKGGVIVDNIFRIISLSKNPLGGTIDVEATDDRVTVASIACVSTCQQFCETTCQVGCESVCQGSCEQGCEGSCESSCQLTCEQGCQSTCQRACQTSCQMLGCQVTCQTACQAGCQGPCQSECQTTCQLACQTGCEISCQGNCQLACQQSCELSVQNVCGSPGHCEQACEQTVQSGCGASCQTNCQLSGCQSACQLSGCQTQSEQL